MNEEVVNTEGPNGVKLDDDLLAATGSIFDKEKGVRSLLTYLTSSLSDELARIEKAKAGWWLEVEKRHGLDRLKHVYNFDERDGTIRKLRDTTRWERGE